MSVWIVTFVGLMILLPLTSRPVEKRFGAQGRLALKLITTTNIFLFLVWLTIDREYRWLDNLVRLTKIGDSLRNTALDWPILVRKAVADHRIDILFDVVILTSCGWMIGEGISTFRKGWRLSRGDQHQIDEVRV